MDMPDPYTEYIKRTWLPQMHRRSAPNSQIFSDYNTPGDFRMGKESRDVSEALPSPEPQPTKAEDNNEDEGNNEEKLSDEEESVRNAIHVLQQLKIRPYEVQNFFQSGG